MDIKKELHEKLDEFATHNDSLEEIFENKEQIEVSRFYERLLKPHAMAIEEWLNDKIYHRRTDEPKNLIHEFVEWQKDFTRYYRGYCRLQTPLLVRALIQQAAEVKVVMTSSKDFVSPLTLSTLSKNPVLSTFTTEDSNNPVWNDHVELGQWADLLLVAPATANTLSSMVHGR